MQQQLDGRTMEYMWADAGDYLGKVGKALAKANPLRWVGGTVQEAMAALLAESKADGKKNSSRAVTVRTKSITVKEEEHTFDTFHEALAFMQRLLPPKAALEPEPEPKTVLEPEPELEPKTDARQEYLSKLVPLLELQRDVEAAVKGAEAKGETLGFAPAMLVDIGKQIKAIERQQEQQLHMETHGVQSLPFHVSIGRYVEPFESTLRVTHS